MVLFWNISGLVDDLFPYEDLSVSCLEKKNEEF